MGEVMKEAQFSLAEAKFTVGNDFNALVLQNVTKAQIKVPIAIESSDIDLNLLG